ncbi:MAG: M1 family aminopeptidase [Bacteroidia bacterium]
MYKYIFPISLFALILACGHQKNITKTDPQQTHWRQAKQKPAPDPNVNVESRPDYHASETRETDLLHTSLQVRFDWTNKWMYGKATISARPYFYPTAFLKLDARGMQINRVAILMRDITSPMKYAPDTMNLQYTYDGKMLNIDLGRQYTRTESYTVFIDYISKPDELKDVGGSAAISEDKGLYFINPGADQKDSVLHPRQIWTQGETQSNCVWMPTIDRPNQKMTSEIYITTEDKYVTLSNGVLYDQKKNDNGTRTDHWRMDLPHSPYLVMMAVGQFAVIKDKYKDKEVNYYVEPQFAPYAKQTFGKTPKMIEFFSKTLGVDYPWAKYSQVCARDYVSGAMENTTATLHSDFVQRDDREYLDNTYEEYVSHELFHMWFGDYVTCESWSNLPLNESFATYGEYLWNEHEYGKEEADYAHYDSYRGYMRESAGGSATKEWPGKREPLIRFNYEDREDMFDSHSYNKGGQVLHMLRQYAGDEAFFASLKLYLETNKYQNVEITNLRLAFEQVTGKDWNWFFNEWFMSPGHPELDLTYSFDGPKQKQMLIVKQTQDRTHGAPVFRIPLSVDIYSGGKVKREEIVVKSVADTFYFESITKPDFVNVDAQKTLLCFKVDHHTAKEWAFLYDNSKLYVDRLEALNNLAPRAFALPDPKKVEDAPTEEMMLPKKMLTKALNDEFWGIRELACTKFSNDANGVKAQLIALSKNDPKSDVRTTAIDVLNEGATGDDMKDVYLAALNDKSYNVITSALQALAEHFKETGLAEAAKRENDPARMMKLAVANAYTYAGSDAQQPWFEKTMYTMYGVTQAEFLQQYGVFLTNCSTATVQKSIAGFENLYNTSTSQLPKLYSKSILSQLSGYYNQKSKESQAQMNELKSVKKNATGLQKLESEKADADMLARDLDEAAKRLK